MLCKQSWSAGGAIPVELLVNAVGEVVGDLRQHIVESDFGSTPFIFTVPISD